MGFLKSIFGGGNKENTAEPTVTYKGFQIQVSPQNTNGGWTTEAIITMQKEEQQLTHHFIRADVSSDREGAASLAVSKAQSMIDQVGEKIFTSK